MDKENLQNQDSAPDILSELEKLEELDEETKVKQKVFNYNLFNKLLMVVVIIFLVILFVLSSYNRYYIINWKDTKLTWNEKAFIDNFNNYKTSVFSFFWIQVKTSPHKLSLGKKNFQSQSVKTQVNEFIDSQDMSYIEKKDQIVSFLDDVVSNIKADSSSIDKIKMNIWAYWFLPKDVDEAISDNSLQRLVVSVEAVKFFSALQFFYYLDSFINEFANYAGYRAEGLADKIKGFLDRWEVDVQRYLTDCHLNPYEIWDDCNLIWDFDKYYDISSVENLDDKSFDRKTFKLLLNFINKKLESDVFPKLSVTLTSLNPVDNEISFMIDINTFSEDELWLLKKWILNPHIYISSVLLNLLRQSHFIVWESIKVDSLKVNKQKVNISDNEFLVNNSRFNFQIPVQKSVEREIFDYVYNK